MISYVLVFSVVLYSCWLCWVLFYSWRQNTILAAQGASVAATILFACRNEQKALPALLASLKSNSLDGKDIVAVDDGSTDDSVTLLRKAEATGLLRLMRYVGPHGKRPALAAALATFSTPYVLQTDADCQVPSGWAPKALQILASTQADLLILPVRFKMPSRTFWADVLQTELASIMAVTAATARAGVGVMCNGANLAYTLKLWQEAAPALAGVPFLGGDDMFLLDYARHKDKQIAYSDAKGTWVDTEAPTTLGAFLHQRRRWASKWPGYTSAWPVAVATISMVGQIGFAGGVALSLLGMGGIFMYVALASKVALEALLLSRQLQKAGHRFGLGAFLFWQVAYVPYLCAVAIPAIFTPPPKTWKKA